MVLLTLDDCNFYSIIPDNSLRDGLRLLQKEHRISLSARIALSLNQHEAEQLWDKMSDIYEHSIEIIETMEGYSKAFYFLDDFLFDLSHTLLDLYDLISHKYEENRNKDIIQNPQQAFTNYKDLEVRALKLFDYGLILDPFQLIHEFNTYLSSSGWDMMRNFSLFSYGNLTFAYLITSSKNLMSVCYESSKEHLPEKEYLQEWAGNFLNSTNTYYFEIMKGSVAIPDYYNKRWVTHLIAPIEIERKNFLSEWISKLESANIPIPDMLSNIY